MKYLFLLSCALVVSNPALAQDAAGTKPEKIELTPLPVDGITVLGSGQPERVTETGQSISVIGANEIALVQGPDLTRVLERLPGVSLARSGQLGSQTSLFVRGANSQQLVVTLDGVRLADVAAPSGGFDFGTLVPAGIGSIELLRGSNSVVWGSDAIGGVLALTSAQLEGLRAGIEYGANDTFSGDLALGTLGQNYGVTVTGGLVSSDGISAFARGTEPDGFRQWHGSLTGYVNLSDQLKLTLAGRYADSKVDIDGFPAPTFAFADTPEYQTTRQASGRVGLGYEGSSLTLRAGLAYSDTRRDYFSTPTSAAPNFATKGRSLRADLAGKADLTDSLTLNFGADSEWTRFSTSFDRERTSRLASGHVLLGYHAGGVHLSAGVRLDDHDRFGSRWTFGANGSVELTTNLRLRASYGEGFKAPTLYQLYGFGGNVGLVPETSRAYEAGLEYGDRNGTAHAALTVFRRDAVNLIDYVFPAGYFNTGRTRAEGFELEGGVAPTDTLRVRAIYSYIRATDRATGRDLARRPRHLLSSSIDWTSPLAGLKLGADLRLVGDSFDDRGNFTRLDSHGLLTLRAALPLGERFELYGRVENVTQSRYQTVANYGTYGRSAYAGVRVKW